MENSNRLEKGSLYTVGWIAALSIELTAAIQMLDEHHDPPADYRPQPTDTNAYVFGRVGEHNVIIAFLEAGAYGTVPAATTATNLFRSFPGIRMCLLVGIGAGVRRKGFDVRLGDVVISQPDGKSGGVYQYDLQKARSDGQLEKIGVLNRPSTLLLKILKRVQAHHDAYPSKVPEYAKRITREMEPPFNKPGYVHQGLENDRLFKSTFSHTSESSAVDHEDFDFDDSDTGEPSRICPHCPSEEEVKRRVRPSGTDPQFHYGTIASGNTLVKDASMRNNIVAQVPGDCICFEMEAAGMMNNFPCLVIRGICDYADSPKNDRWQPYAALTAAAYTREFLEFAPRGDVETGKPLAEQLEDISRTMHSIQKTTAEANVTLQVQKVEKWLSPFDPSDNYNIAIDKRNEGLSNSGRWLLQSQTFCEWKNTKNSFLWLHGLAGCGKTILCSTAIEHLKSDADRIVLYFYFAFNDQRTRSKGSMVRSLIMQLSRYDERAMEQLREQKKGKKDEQPSDAELGKMFMSMATRFEQVTIVLDAIDELEREGNKRRDVLRWIKETISSDTADVRILASSRNERDIRMELDSIHVAFQLTAGIMDEDIKAFVHKQIHDESSRLHRWRNRPDVQAMIEAKLTKKANGMFRWVACQIQAIHNCLDLKSLREQLSSLPKSLDETYDRIMQDLCKTHQREAIKLLQFLAFAERPLELLEAVDLIAVDLTETPSFDPINRIPEPLELVEVCSSLVVLDLHNPDCRRLQLAHFSVKEYLVSGRIGTYLLEHFKEVSAHSSMVKTCLGYLESILPSVTSIWVNVPDDMTISNQYQKETDAAWKHDLSKFPLMDYAIYTWPVHARRCNQHKGTAIQIQKFFEHESCLIKWLFCFGTEHFRPVYIDEHKGLRVSCPVLLSIYLRLETMALEMIHNGFNLEAEVISEEVLCLLENYSNEASEDGMAYGKCTDRGCRMTSHLYLATYNGMHDVVKALIERDVDVHEDGGEWGTALNIACDQSWKNITATLLQRSRDTVSQECHEKYVQGALNIIVTNWDMCDPDEVVTIRDQLAESCLVLNYPSLSLDYCLVTVFFDLNLDLARRLVRKGACMGVVAHYYRKCLFLDEDFLLSFFHLFLEDESDVAGLGALHELFRAHPIQQTITKGFNKALRFMIGQGADREGYVPLDEFGSDTEQCTTLFWAVKRRNTVAVQILLHTNIFSSVLIPHEICFIDYTPSQHYMNEKNGYEEETCLHMAAKWNCIEIMKELISCKAELEVKDLYSRTPLHHACIHECLEAVKLLVESGAKLHVLDCFKKTPLNLARESQNKAVIEFLEQQNSHMSSDGSFHPKRKNEVDNDDGNHTKRDSKRQRTRQLPLHPATSSQSPQVCDTPPCTETHRTHPRTRRGAALARQ